MRKPKPPTPLRVSATLRTAAFRASSGLGAEGYRVSWNDSHPANQSVRVEFCTPNDGTSRGLLEATALRDRALIAMAATLRHKGWQVIPMDRPSHLLVKGA